MQGSIPFYRLITKYWHITISPIRAYYRGFYMIPCLPVFWSHHIATWNTVKIVACNDCIDTKSLPEPICLHTKILWH